MSQNNPLLNKKYQALFSQYCDQKGGGGVAIIHKSDLILVPLFPEFHSRNFLLVRLSSQSSWPVLLIAVYFPPDHARKQEMVAHVIRTLEYLRARYRSFGLIVFGDLNSDFTRNPESPDCKRMMRMIRACSLEIHRDHNPKAVTRSQGSKSSYLDYFLTTGVKISNLNVGESIGSSDHRIISCESTSLTPVRRRRQKIFSKRRAADLMMDMLSEDIANGTMDHGLYELGPIDFFQRLSYHSRMHSIVFEPKPMNYFKVIQMVEEELSQSSPNWERIRKAVSRCKRTEFLALLEKAKSCKLENDLKSFHMIVQNIMKLRKQNTSVHEIDDPQDAGQVIHEPERLRRTLSEKYQLLFGSTTSREPFQVGDISPATNEEIEMCLGAISCGKGMGMDCIPDTILHLPHPKLRRKLRQFVNAIFKDRMIPPPFSYARLHLLNKLKSGVPSLEDLRPIMITSPLIKLIESVALVELKSKLEPAITASQIGFVSKLGTHVHILRLLSRIIDIKDSPRFKSGRWFSFFIDFKSAFDKVDHQILFKKLQGSGISQRTINILRLLYNSYHFSLSEDDRPNKINSGVAQGSLLSPLLYDWYVNDLVLSLSERFGTEYTFAYADDVAVLCLGYSDIRTALSITEDWCTRNGALINKKKCGILPIRRREIVSTKKDIGGVPIVLEYKYLGVPLDSALTLKHVLTLVKGKVKKFSQRIGFILNGVIGTTTKLNLWQTYARCHFDYFSPAMAICNCLHKFESLLTGSLKKALDLPLRLPNERLLKATGTPTLTQIAGYHLRRNKTAILERFGRCSSSLTKVSEDLNLSADQYLAMRKIPCTEEVSQGRFKVDLLAIAYSNLNKELLGLSTGVYLTLRCTDPSQGPVGSIKPCTICKVPGTQAHFLNDCPINSGPRKTLKEGMPLGIRVPLLVEGSIAVFFEQIRELEVLASTGIEVTSMILEPLARATLLASTTFVVSTLSANIPDTSKGF
jgi:hypothetical protein